MISWMVRNSIALVPWSVRGWIKSQPALAFAQRKLLDTFLLNREFVHIVDAGPAQGLRYAVELPADKGVWTGTYELPFSEALSKAVAPGDVCYDIGGWRGFFSGVMALANAGKVIVFEPLAENAERVRRVIELNPGLPIELIGCAVGEKEGRAEFLVMPQTSMGKLADSEFQKTEKAVEKITVDIATLDSLIERGEIAPPNVVKIDVEGAEFLVLKGFSRALGEYKPALFLEIHTRDLARACENFLRMRGYDVVVLETSLPPDFESEPEVCHFVAKPSPERQPGIEDGQSSSHG